MQCRIWHCLESHAVNCFRFEPRWLESLSKLKLPIQLLWGDSDAVSPMSIPRTLATFINPDYLTFTILPDTGKQLGCPNRSLSINYSIFLGHFLTLEKPELWIDRIVKFVSKHHWKLWMKHIWHLNQCWPIICSCIFNFILQSSIEFIKKCKIKVLDKKFTKSIECLCLV